MRHKLQISAATIASAAVFILGLLAFPFFFAEKIGGNAGTLLIIGTTLQTLIIYLLSLLFVSLTIFWFLKRRVK